MLLFFIQDNRGGGIPLLSLLPFPPSIPALPPPPIMRHTQPRAFRDNVATDFIFPEWLILNTDQVAKQIQRASFRVIIWRRRQKPPTTTTSDFRGKFWIHSSRKLATNFVRSREKQSETLLNWRRKSHPWSLRRSCERTNSEREKGKPWWVTVWKKDLSLSTRRRKSFCDSTPSSIQQRILQRRREEKKEIYFFRSLLGGRWDFGCQLGSVSTVLTLCVGIGARNELV